MPLLAQTRALVLQPTQLITNLMDQCPLERVQIWRKLKLIQSIVILERLEQVFKVLALFLISLLIIFRLLSFRLVLLICLLKSGLPVTWLLLLLFTGSLLLLLQSFLFLFKPLALGFAPFLPILGYPLSRCTLSRRSLLLLISRTFLPVAGSDLVIACIVKRCAHLAMLPEIPAKRRKECIRAYSATVTDQAAEPFGPSHGHIHPFLIGQEPDLILGVRTHHRDYNDFFFPALEAIHCGNLNAFGGRLADFHFFQLFADFAHLCTVRCDNADVSLRHPCSDQFLDNLDHKVDLAYVIL